MRMTAWSITRKNDYDACPAKAKYKHLMKLPDPPGPAMARGSEIHKSAEQFIIGAINTIPETLSKVADTLRWLREHYEQGTAWVEQDIAFDKNWKPVDWFDMARAWVRVKADVIVREGSLLTIIDWKTGKYKDGDEHVPQLNLYAVTGLLKNEEIERAEGQLIFTDHTEVPVRKAEGSLSRAELPKALKKWEKDVARMLADEKFEPTPGRACHWCPYSKAKGGPCRY